MAKFEQWNSLLKKFVVTSDINSQWKYQIIVVNDKKINDVVAIQTHVIILPFGAVLTYAITPNSPIPTKWSN